MKKKNKLLIGVFIVIAIIVGGFGGIQYRKAADYKQAKEYYKAGAYKEAMGLYEKLENYKNSAELFMKSEYNYGLKLKENGSYDEALEIFEKLGNYKNAAGEIIDCHCEKAKKEIVDGNFDKAEGILEPIASEEKAKHLLYVIDLKERGIDALCDYVKENFKADGNGDYSKNTIVNHDGEKYKIWTIYEPSENKMRFDIEKMHKRKGEASVIYYIEKEGKASFTLISSNTTKVSATYAYYNDTIYSNGEYWVGWIVNAHGDIDLRKFNEKTKINIDKMNKISVSENKDMPNDKGAYEKIVNKYTQIMLKGIQQFLDEEDLMCSISELGFNGGMLK